MLDHFSIFTKGGIVLWSYTAAKLRGSPVDELVRSVLLEERTGDNSFVHDMYALRWTFANEFDLIFVVVYQKILSLLYIDDLLDIVSKKFCEEYNDQIKSIKKSLKDCRFEFTDMFTQILSTLENKVAKQKMDRGKGPRNFEKTQKGQKTLQESGKDNKANEPRTKEGKQESPVTSGDEQDFMEENENPASGGEDASELTQEQIQANLERLKKKAQGKGKKQAPIKSPATSTRAPRNRTWDDKVTRQEKEELDYSRKYGKTDSSEQESSYKGGIIDLDKWEETEEVEEEVDDVPKEKDSKKQSGGGWMNFLKGLAGNKALEKQDLVPVLVQFKEHLISKNVAAEIAEKLCESVSTSLEGKKLGTFQGVKSTVKSALEEAVKRILTPKKNIDILRDVIEAKKKGRPYVMVFVGVNGVGKSTNLAKICSYLQQNGHQCLIAACDTFRSGAVEQLGVHCRRLGVELFERGYRNDATQIAQDAIIQAKQSGKDVVLIDTAGRMQDNAPLMQALSKLVNTIKPDLVLFVGEALVGNDAVDQVSKFNQALMDLSKDKEPRLIDGIILTKFDTIDDKVGAAISMVYITGQPIVFLGTGQHYTDLKRLNVNVVTKALLKGS